jgi:ATP-dependent RNA helicase DDX31/DBP7
VIAKASTGTGKTLAYLIPLINQYIQNKVITQRDCGTVTLIICPSRELCIQGQKEVLRCLKRCPFIVPGSLIGGEQTNHEKNRLRKGINILFSTPGRLLYHLQNTQSFKYSNLKTLIFEEADRTLDMGFQQNVHKILDLMGKNIKSEYYQKILVSAHFNEKVETLLTDLKMDNPQYIGFETEPKE